tara:strand:+ start:159 stop:608 length:450 start_codon:yes stop_codon:yes gene_type:complete
MPNLTLAICELYTPYFHGYTENSSKNIYGHFIITVIINLDEFYNNEYKDDINMIIECYRIWCCDEGLHPIIRNYHNMITNHNYIKLEIVEIDELNGGETVGYIKTFWLKILQRKWKKKFKKRKIIIQKAYKMLKYREIYGNWNQNLLKF